MPKWKGWVCGTCKWRLRESEVVDTIPPTGQKLHNVEYLADYAGDQPRYETAFCGPVRFYPSKEVME